MLCDDNAKILHIGSPEANAFFESTKRAMTITPRINQLTFNDMDEIRTFFRIIGDVTVGENSVIAAGSIVTKDVPPNTLVAGNPAKVIRSI